MAGGDGGGGGVQFLTLPGSLNGKECSSKPTQSILLKAKPEGRKGMGEGGGGGVKNLSAQAVLCVTKGR